MDDILDSVSSVEEAINLAENVNVVLAKGGFRVKSWTISGENIKTVKKEVECEYEGINIMKPVSIACESTGLLKRVVHDDCIDSSTQKVLGIVWSLGKGHNFFCC